MLLKTETHDGHEYGHGKREYLPDVYRSRIIFIRCLRSDTYACPHLGGKKEKEKTKHQNNNIPCVRDLMPPFLSRWLQKLRELSSYTTVSTRSDYPSSRGSG